MPISAVDTISLAFRHTKEQIFQPFRFGQWAITVAVVVGCILLAIFLYLVALISVPVIVFFPRIRSTSLRHGIPR